MTEKNPLPNYNYTTFLSVGVGCILVRGYLSDSLLQLGQVFHLYYPPAFYSVCTDIGLFIFCIYILYASIREQHYHRLTGRSYPKDHSSLKKGYKELLTFFSKNDPYKIDIDQLPIEDWHDADGVILCKVKDQSGNYRLLKRASDANGNLVSFGLPGSGKSTTQAATTAIRFNAHRQDGGCGVFAISIKGDLLNFIRSNGKRKSVKVFTPDRADGSYHYDPLHSVDAMSWTDRRIFAENLSICICPEESGENSHYFVDGSRDYLTASILYLLHLHDIGKRPGKLKFPEIVDLILQNNVFDLTLTIQDCGNPIPGEYTNGYIGSNEKNVSGIWSHLCKRIRPFNSGALRTLLDGQGDCITPDDLSSADIVIDVPQDKYDVYAGCMAVIVTNFIQAFMRRDDVSSRQDIVPVMFLLDEVVQLKLDRNILCSAMSTLRSKKVSLFLLLQSVAQLEGYYGETHAREIIDLCAYISVFNAQDPRSREYFQKLIGKRKMLRRSTSLSSPSGNKSDTTGVSVSETEEYIFEAADFGDLTTIDPKTKKRTPHVLVYANGKYLLGETTPCYL